MSDQNMGGNPLIPADNDIDPANRTLGRKKFQPYEWDDLNNIVVDEPKELAALMDADKTKAARQLYSRAISDWVKNNSQDMYSELLYIIEKQFPNNTPENVAAGVAKAIYILDRDRLFKAYDGTTDIDVKGVARHLEQNFDRYKNILTNPLADLYLYFETRGFEERAKKYQKNFALYTPDRALNLMILDLDHNRLVFEDTVYTDVQQLMDAYGESGDRFVSEVINPYSRISLWLDVSYPRSVARINAWRNEVNNQNADTLRYALNISGYRLNGQEVNDAEAFYSLLHKNISQFTTSDNAQLNINNAAYWLGKYQNTSLTLYFDRLLNSGNLSQDDFAAVFAITASLPGTDSLKLAGQVTDLMKQIPDLSPENRSRLVNAAANTFNQYLNTSGAQAKYALDGLEKMLATVEKIQSTDGDFAGLLLGAMDLRVKNDIHSDINKLKYDSEAFVKYYPRLIDFLKRAELILPTLPFLTDFKQKLDQIGLIKVEIDTRYDALRANDRASAAYALLQGSHENIPVNYQPLFKSYMFILWITASITIAYSMGLIFSIAEDASPGMMIGLGIIMSIFTGIFSLIGYWFCTVTKFSDLIGKFLAWSLKSRPVVNNVAAAEQVKPIPAPVKTGGLDTLNFGSGNELNQELLSGIIKILLTDYKTDQPGVASITN